MKYKSVVAFLSVLGFSLFNSVAALAETALLNVSYDPTREFYQAFNTAFSKHWKIQTGEDLVLRQSHGGSGKQARAVIDGLEADVVTLALAYDIDAIQTQTGKIPADWAGRLPNQSVPYVSTIVFLVRKGNPKNIKDWPDLVRSDVSVVTPNPKTSGGARWNYLAAWGYALHHAGGDQQQAKSFIASLLKRVPVLDTGARGATTTFAQRGIGDVLMAWENEAFLVQNEFGADKFEIVTPSETILAEPPVAVVQANAQKHGTLKQANAYLEYLFSPTGQQLAAQYYYRPTKTEGVETSLLARFAKLKTFTVKSLGGWTTLQKQHFDEGGIFDQVYLK